MLSLVTGFSAHAEVGYTLAKIVCTYIYPQSLQLGSTHVKMKSVGVKLVVYCSFSIICFYVSNQLFLKATKY